CMQGKDFPYSF
nr:immunoglobulin light chain junction region [Macaca mulatta]